MSQDDLTSITQGIMSDEEAIEIAGIHKPHIQFKDGLRALLNAFAQRAGVTGERLDGFSCKHEMFSQSSDRACYSDKLQATLYIHPPAPVKKSAEERIEEALKVTGKFLSHYHSDGPLTQIQRILRGEE